MSNYSVICWNEAEEERSARWRSEKGLPPPKHTQVIDDRMTADSAYRLACEGTALLWRGDFQNARQLLLALSRRIERKKTEHKKRPLMTSPAGVFHRYRLAQSQRARILEKLLIPLQADHSIPLRRAPKVQSACLEVYGPVLEDYVISLRELLGLIGAYEWRRKGIEIPTLDARIHPHYGVFAPIRHEYVGLVAQTPLPAIIATHSVAFDIGTGTGVLAAVMAHRGVKRIIATDHEARALLCAQDNLTRLGYIDQVEVKQINLFPSEQAALIVCNPPWIPARPSSPLEHAIFDHNSGMLHGFLHNLASHLLPGGEGWLILSDIAEHLGLRTRMELITAIEAAGLKILGRSDTKPFHSRVADTHDPLHAARAVELTSLWRLAVK